MDIKELLGKRIREYRKKRNMTQFQLAEMLGVDDKHLSRIELGKNMPQSSMISKICEVLEIEPKELFEFYHLDKPKNIKNELKTLIDKLDEEQIVLAYKYVRNFVI